MKLCRGTFFQFDSIFLSGSFRLFSGNRNILKRAVTILSFSREIHLSSFAIFNQILSLISFIESTRLFFFYYSEQNIPYNPININTKWKQYGVTVAGGNDNGNQLNQLAGPSGIYVDDDHQCIYIADCQNKRIMRWTFNARSGQIVAGGNGFGSRSDQLKNARDVIVDKKTDSLVICDTDNYRVVQWPCENGTNGETILSHISCAHAVMDHEGDLYISDYYGDVVRRYQIGNSNGTIVAGGNGRGNRLDQLDRPGFIFVDKNCSVYVSERGNHRVVKWLDGAKEGIVVAGEQDQRNRLTQLNRPTGLIVDHLENIYVCDSGNSRVMYWPKGSTEGRIIVGGNGKGNASNQLDCPKGLAFDRQGNLYVVDWANHRVQKFNVDFD